MKATRHWRVVYPSSRRMDLALPRAVMLISAALDTNQWTQEHISDTRNMVAVRINRCFGIIMVNNIYVECDSSVMVERFWGHLASHHQGTQSTGGRYMLWGGDFNRHHPMWDEEQNCHLFTAATLREVDKHLALVADYGMEMLLPKDVPTLEVMVTKTGPVQTTCLAVTTWGIK